jgi:hypothetical protein
MGQSRSPKYPADQGRSRKGIDEAAARARKALRFDPLEPISAFECMYRLREYRALAAGRELPVVYGVKQLEPGVKGETHYSARHSRLEITLSEETYEQLDRPFAREDPHARFSFFHELGHATLHGTELVRLSRIPKSQADAMMRDCSTKVHAYRDVEWQANTFAASMMMPFAALRELRQDRSLTVAELCRVFLVSRKSAEIRLQVFWEEN